MGVRGLTSFLNDNPQLLTKIELCNSDVVVDGNCLCHKLYHDFNLEPFLGGDYDRFRVKLVSYLSSLCRCGLRLHVVFDGGFNDLKLETSISRAKQRLSVVRKANRGVFGGHLLPILAVDVVREALLDLAIDYTQSDFEADDHIAALANRLACPVLSQDSDFFIYPLTHGYIQLDTLGPNPKVRRNADGSHALPTNIYSVDNLLKRFHGLQPQALALLAVLLGNDFVSSFNFDSFFSNIRLPKKNDSQLSRTGSAAGAKVIGLLVWMQHKTVDEAISKIVSYVKAEKKIALEKAIRRGMDTYVINNEVLDDHSFLDNRISVWFGQRFRAGEIPAFILNVAVRQRVFLMSQVEDWDREDSYACSRTLRRYLYGIVLQSPQLTVTEYGHTRGEFSRDLVEPIVSLNDQPLPSIQTIPQMSEEQRRALLLNMLGLDHSVVTNSFPNEFMLILCVIVYWVKSSSTRVTSGMLCSLLLSLLTVFCVGCFRRWSSNRKAESERWPVVRLMWERKAERRLCDQRWIKYNCEPRMNNACPTDLYTLHCYSQLQTCLKIVTFINRLLCCPLPHCYTASFLNGTLLYNAYREVKNKAQPHLHLEDTLKDEPNFGSIYKSVWQWIVYDNKCETFIERSDAERATVKKKKTKKRKKRNRGKGSTEEAVVAQPSSDDELHCPGGDVEANCQVSNKFDNLIIDND